MKSFNDKRKMRDLNADLLFYDPFCDEIFLSEDNKLTKDYGDLFLYKANKIDIKKLRPDYADFYLLLFYIACYPSDVKIYSGNGGYDYKVKRGTKVTDESIYSIYKILDYSKDKKDLEITTLPTLRHTIEDSLYFTDIPLVNEIDHLDNGILYNDKTCFSYEKGEEWDHFTIDYKLIRCEIPKEAKRCPCIENRADFSSKGHEKL